MQISGEIIGWEGREDKPEIPNIDDFRPPFCPCCGALAREARQLQLIGHGSYPRWVHLPQSRKIRIRRFLCKRCRRTSSVLPRGLLPRFQYTAPVILSSLVRYHVDGERASVVTAQFGARTTKHGWGTLRRWGAAFLVSVPLWGWLGKRLGRREETPWSREQVRIHVERFLAGFSLQIRARTQPGLDEIVRRSLRNMVFDGPRAWSSLHTTNGRRWGHSPPASRLGPPTQRAGLPRDPP
jgi:hypothetical protein